MIDRRFAVPVHTDAWMQGDRFGVVTKVTPAHVHVLMDRSRKVRRFPRFDFELYAREATS